LAVWEELLFGSEARQDHGDVAGYAGRSTSTLDADESLTRSGGSDASGPDTS
jgi:hypothetical protein